MTDDTSRPPGRPAAQTPAAIRRSSILPALGGHGMSVLPETAVTVVIAGELASSIELHELDAWAPAVRLYADLDAAAAHVSTSLGVAGFVLSFAGPDDERRVEQEIDTLRANASRLPGLTLGLAPTKAELTWRWAADHREVSHAGRAGLIEAFVAHAVAQRTDWLRRCDALAQSRGLSSRQAQIAMRYAIGTPRAAIAASLGMQESSLATQERRARHKLGGTRLQDLVAIIVPDAE